MRSVKSVSERSRSRPRPVAGRAKSAVDSDDDDAMSVKSVASTNIRPRARPIARSKSIKPTDDNDIIDISSGDDAMSVKSSKSTKSAMSIDDEEWITTPPRRSHSIVPTTPVSSRTSSVKRSVSLMVSPITDEESIEMMPSPTKSVCFQKDISSAPLKGVLKKPEVVIPIKSHRPMSISNGWDDEDVFADGPKPDHSRSPKKPLASKTVPDDEVDLWSPFEDDSNAKDTPKKRLGKGKTAVNGFFADEHDTYLEDYATSAGPPKVDETDINNRDPLLEATYKDLPKLRAACIISWSHKKAIMPSYSGMLDEVPRVNKDLFFQSIVCSGVNGILNLSQSDPAKISTGFGSQTYFHAVGGSGPFTFISTIRVSECYLIDPKPSANGKTQRLIEGALVEGKWEQLVGAIGQVINKLEYKAQIQAGYLSFSTSFASPVPGTPSSSNSRGVHCASGPNPFTRGPSSGGVTLNCHDIVPIYDARKYTQSFLKLVPDIDQLDRINRELPPGSCAIVAYTVNRALYTEPWVLLDSIKSPSAVHQESTRSSTGVQQESSRSPTRVQLEFTWSPSGVHLEY
ncbi:hypothetical protein PILCRDRAFT_14243 [Piloderma croceum F 1598]|uniref:Uncharacterized protein n=1 Tax=Piloderma croceum (strain F 1598) TaxID=765440 RepID=A0A0C3F3T6_PILCF|nr:hypothetical protein PILCRDRAFT_14243 [Piloderma croceum F 1598]